MPLAIVQGPPNSGRAGAILKRFRAQLDREPLLVVPTGDDVAGFERELCRPPDESDGDRGDEGDGGDGRRFSPGASQPGPGAGATLGGSVVTFAGLVAEVAAALAVEAPPPLTVAERQALVRAAIRRVGPRRLRRSAARPGFGPALDALIAELQAAMISPAAFAAEVAELEGGAGHEVELAQLYAAYVELRDAAKRSDAGLLAERAIAALRAEPEAWQGRPVLLYGFDDLSRAQRELVAALAAATEVTVAVAYDDRRALAPRAGLLTRLREEIGAAETVELEFDRDYAASATLSHLDRNLFESGAEPLAPDDGLVMLECAGARGEAEAIGIEVARLLASGCEADEIAIVVRHPATAGPLIAAVLSELGVPVALSAPVSLATTAVGGSLLALCRAALDDGAVEDLLAHLRCDPALEPNAVDWLERRVRRGSVQTVSEAASAWSRPPRHLARLREAGEGPAALRALARSARELAEGAHRRRAPLAARRAGAAADGAEGAHGAAADGVENARGAVADGVGGAADDPASPPFSALELRAGVAAAELLEELARIDELPGCEPAGIAAAIEAIEAASVPRWRGPATGRVRIIDPYRARAARVRHLFCASLQDGEFPSAAPPDPLLGEQSRRALGDPDLRRAEPADEERYLFHACVARPTDRLYLSWQSSDEDGKALGRSPFVDEVLDLVAADPADPPPGLIRTRGPERSVPALDEATTPRQLARALALCGGRLDREAALAKLGAGPELAARALDLLAAGPDPEALPGPLRVPEVLEALGSREVFSAGSLEGWLECPYRWFVGHELRPERLEPEADPLWLGGLVHDALERLYRDPPGEDAIPRPGDVARWRRRFGELLAECATERGGAPLNHARRVALDRARVQVEAFLDAEAESEAEFRPLHLELAFGPMGEAEGDREPLRIGEIALRGRIDRIDVARDGRSAVVRDYKTGASVRSAGELAETATLQIQLYMRAAERLLDLDPIAGLYHPLGAARDDKRRPRGIARRDDERLDPLELVRNDRCPPDEVEAALDEAERRAAVAAREMRAGEIGRRPIGGVCPEYCTFQPICRKERVLGAVGDERGKASANGNGRGGEG